MEAEDFLEWVTVNDANLAKASFINYTPCSLSDIFISVRGYLIESRIQSISDLEKILVSLADVNSVNFAECFNSFWLCNSKKPPFFLGTKKFKKDLTKEWHIEEITGMQRHILTEKYLKMSIFDQLLIDFEYQYSIVHRITPHLAGFFACKSLEKDDYLKIIMYTQKILSNCESKDVVLQSLDHDVNDQDFSFIVGEFVNDRSTFCSRLFYPKAHRKNWQDKVRCVWEDIKLHILSSACA
ncbi:hypothetical protein [Candidatus Spongiihabitans sp.]|uniref:hypothetical protein n=1 Tax=Candidatus Spongiihabitans sp. TaxID=3101308 RepID=UPI003C6F58FC